MVSYLKMNLKPKNIYRYTSSGIKNDKTKKRRINIDTLIGEWFDYIPDSFVNKIVNYYDLRIVVSGKILTGETVNWKMRYHVSGFSIRPQSDNN